MNIFKKLYCRIYQAAFKIMIPLLPYREPKILKTNAEVGAVLRERGFDKVMLVTDKGIRGLGLTQRLEEELKEKGISLFVYDEVVPNPTTDNVMAALEIYKTNGCQALIAFGGGSVMDCAKAVGAKVARPKKSLKKMKGVLKVRKKIPLLVAVPTTAGTGSETTLAAVITDSQTRHKYAINDFPLIPKYALLDASLTAKLPKHITSTTGMDALTHAVEAYIGRSSTKGTRKNAMFAIKTIFENILEVYENGENLQARENMLLASYNAGLAFTKSYVGYVHAIAHSLGGKYNIAHGLANAVILPYVLKAFGKKIYKKLWEMGVFAGLFDKNTSKEEGAKIFIEKIEQLNKKMNIPSRLEQIQEEDIPQLARTAEKEGNPLYPVPVLFTSKQLEKIYHEVKNG
ncbi:MAG: iron-containing alcohol dehydrogenase [Clostridia bacterium]|nr:iron-containing alcohol dehydrogenase [Clostridia bacterium]